MHYLDLTIKDLHRELVAKNVTPLELTIEAIRRAKADPHNAFEYIYEFEAIELAKKLVTPEPDNYLWGIPFVIKDNFRLGENSPSFRRRRIIIRASRDYHSAKQIIIRRRRQNHSPLRTILLYSDGVISVADRKARIKVESEEYPTA